MRFLEPLISFRPHVQRVMVQEKARNKEKGRSEEGEEGKKKPGLDGRGMSRDGRGRDHGHTHTRISISYTALRVRGDRGILERRKSVVKNVEGESARGDPEFVQDLQALL